MKDGLIKLEGAQKNLEANGLQEIINKGIAEGDEYCPQTGIFWVVWDDIVVPLVKGIGSLFV